MEGWHSFFFPEYRLDWFDYGPGSPNRTAAFIAVFAVASWWFALQFRRWGYWVSLALFTICLFFLLQTESRGGLVALVGGLGILLVAARYRARESLGAWLGRRSTWARAVALGAIFLAAAWYSGELGMRDRLVSMTSGEDGSTNVRLRLYAAGLAMIQDAPGGVGADQAGDFYAQWYQPVGDTRTYLSLVNSHLTWLAEHGIAFKVAYILAWASVLMLLWPSREGGSLRIAALAAWATLFATGLFSRTLNLPAVWILPGLLLVGVVLERLVRRQAMRKQGVILGLTSAAASMALLLLAARLAPAPTQISADDGLVIAGDLSAEPLWIIAPHRRVLGDKYGHSIREYLDGLGQVRVDHGRAWQSSHPTRILFSGDASPDGALPESAEAITLMNPSLDSIEHWRRVAADRPLDIYLGGMGDWRRARAWREAAAENQRWQLTALPGVVDYIPDWPRHLLDEPLERKSPKPEAAEDAALASGFDPFATNP